MENQLGTFSNCSLKSVELMNIFLLLYTHESGITYREQIEHIEKIMIELICIDS